MEQIIHPMASKNSLVVKDKTRKGKGWFLLWSLTRQSPVTDCQGIFHNYLASKLKIQQSLDKVSSCFLQRGCGR